MQADWGRNPDVNICAATLTGLAMHKYWGSFRGAVRAYLFIFLPKAGVGGKIKSLGDALK
jgi:hypothetical protein